LIQVIKLSQFTLLGFSHNVSIKAIQFSFGVSICNEHLKIDSVLQIIIITVF